MRQLPVTKVQSELAKSGSEALDKLASTDYDLVVTDVSGDEDRRAGVNLIHEIHSRYVEIPIVVHYGIMSLFASAEAKRAGATEVLPSAGLLAWLRGQFAL